MIVGLILLILGVMGIVFWFGLMLWGIYFNLGRIADYLENRSGTRMR
jgi:flagellar basal body-associated protein FliL